MALSSTRNLRGNETFMKFADTWCFSHLSNIVPTAENFIFEPVFASSLVGLSSQLEGVRAFGTDGEKALRDVFSHEFGFAQCLTCFIHVRRNIKAKLTEFNVPSQLSVKILDDIFGRRIGDTFVEGLVDATDDEDFQEKLESVQQSWSSLETTSDCNLEKLNLSTTLMKTKCQFYVILCQNLSGWSVA